MNQYIRRVCTDALVLSILSFIGTAAPGAEKVIVYKQGSENRIITMRPVPGVSGMVWHRTEEPATKELAELTITVYSSSEIDQKLTKHKSDSEKATSEIAKAAKKQADAIKVEVLATINKLGQPPATDNQLDAIRTSIKEELRREIKEELRREIIAELLQDKEFRKELAKQMLQDK